MSYPTRPTLSGSNNEFLLFIHPSIKDRAKVISGYRWDTERKCWVYPKTPQVYKALISEFGDELQILDTAKISNAPVNSTPTVPPEVELSKKNNALQDEVQKLKEQIKAFSQSDHSASEQVNLLKQSISTLEKELSKARQDLLTAEKELHDSKRELLKANAQIESLQLSHQAIKSNSSLEGILKQVALDATGNDRKFYALLTKLKLDDSLPLIVQKEVENDFRKLLNIPANDKNFDMFGLIQQVADKELLSKDAIDLAHTIRKQRNILAHRDTYEKTHQARIILCLFAAALLYPDLPM